MKLLSVRAVLALGIGAACGVLGVLAACSSGSGGSAGDGNGAHQIANGSSGSSASSGSSGSSGSSESDGGSNNSEQYADATVVMYDGPPPNVDGGQLLCATPNGLPIKFSPMYSGFDGVHAYQIPTFVMGVDPGTVTWGSSDPSMVNFQPYVTGIMITTKKAGDVTIVATAGGTCGSAMLHITQYTVDEWNLGNARYNNGKPLNVSFDAAALKNCDASLGFDAADIAAFDGNFAGIDASGFDASGFDAAAELGIQQCIGNPFDNPPAACTNCHGDGSNGKLFGMTLFSDVSHTPEQTGGFSDPDLVNVFAHGTVPPGGYFDPSIVPYANWHLFHTWSDINTTEEQTGMTAYLRSLTPKEQVGCLELFTQSGPGCSDGGRD